MGITEAAGERRFSGIGAANRPGGAINRCLVNTGAKANDIGRIMYK